MGHQVNNKHQKEDTQHYKVGPEPIVINGVTPWAPTHSWYTGPPCKITCFCFESQPNNTKLPWENKNPEVHGDLGVVSAVQLTVIMEITCFDDVLCSLARKFCDECAQVHSMYGLFTDING